MRAITVIGLLLLIVGGINFGSMGVFNYNFLVGWLGNGSFSLHLIYVLIGVAALWQLIGLIIMKQSTPGTE